MPNVAGEAPPRARRPRPPVGAFTSALAAGDAARAATIAGSYLGQVRSRVGVVSDLLHPAQYEIGERWYRGQLGVAEEHRATAIVTRLAAGMPPTPVARPVREGARCLLAGLTRERHVVGIQLLTMALEDEGWIVDVLEPPTTRTELVRAAGDWRPDVVGLSAASMSSPAELTGVVAALHRLRLPVLVGGPLFNRAPGLWRTVGADAHAGDARVATVLMRKLLQ